MKSARLNSSQRLQRVLKVLSDGQEHSTLDIIGQANGVGIVCRRMGDRWLYRIGRRTSEMRRLRGLIAKVASIEVLGLSGP